MYITVSEPLYMTTNREPNDMIKYDLHYLHKYHFSNSPPTVTKIVK